MKEIYLEHKAQSILYSAIFRNKKIVSGVIAAFFFLVLTAVSINTAAQNTLNTIGLSASNPAAAAFSLRKLSSSYSGYAIRVRRSSDNAFQDIGFTVSGNLDQPALLSFTGSGSGYVAIWYDQSGNGLDAFQNTAAAQPRIVNTGAVDLLNGKPVLLFSGSQTLNTPLTAIQATTGGNTTTANFVFNNATIASSIISNADGTGNRYNIHAPFSDGNTYFDIGNISSGGRINGNLTWTNFSIASFRRNNTNGSVRKNGVTAFSTTSFATAASNTNSMWIGSYDGGSGFINGAVAEITIFPSSLTDADMQTVESNQDTYYTIANPVVSNTLNLAGLTNSTTAAAAYSLRKLSSAYTGYAIQARRNKDNAVQNIGFDVSGNLDTASLKTFTGSSSAYIVTWYDQSGYGRDATQSTAAAQPRIVNAGTVDLQNGKASLVFSGSQSMVTTLSGVSATTGGNATTANMVFKNATVASSVLTNGDGGSNRYNIHAPWDDGNTYFDIGNTSSGGRFYGQLTWTDFSIATFKRNNANGSIWKNGASILAATSLSTNVTSEDNIAIGMFINGNISEIIVFASALSDANQHVLECNQDDYYGISFYLVTDFVVTSTASTTGCYTMDEQVVWKSAEMNGLQASGNNLARSSPGSNWNSGTSSLNTVVNNGYLKFTANETTANRIVGLSNISRPAVAGNQYQSIGYAIFVQDNTGVQIYESGAYRGSFGNYTNGDVFKIAVENNVVKYYRNSSLLYTSTVTPVLPLMADATIYTAGGTITNVIISSLSTASVFTATATLPDNGTRPVFQWQVNGINAGTNNASYTNTSLNANDVVRCILRPITTLCRTFASNTITKIDLTPAAPSSPIGTTICSNNTASIAATAAAGTVIDWYAAASGGSVLTGGAGVSTFTTPVLSTTTTFYAESRNTITGCVSASRTAVTVNVTAGATTSAASALCIGTSITLSPVTGGTWTSSNTAVATVTNAGVVTGIAAGAVTFTFYQTSSGCSSTTSTVTVSAKPTVTITADYCIGGGKVRLTCNTQNSYLWSNGATTQTIDVITAGNYTVTGTNAGGCTANDVQVVGNELVVNGDFSGGNTGFTTLYNYMGTAGATALYTEGTYTVANNANNYHNLFYTSKDHSSGSGNFMVVNGSPSSQEIWEQVVTVLPNTNYYFSAWATSLNGGTPFAQLRFAVNNISIGTTAVLPAGPGATSDAVTWYQFYGTWNSGNNTSAIINILDLQTATGGNDFGLDDISFSTLSPTSISLAPTTNSPVCAGSTLNITANVTGGSYPLTYAWTGPSSFTSTSQNPSITSAAAGNAGVYSLVVTDKYGCSTAAAATTAVTVNTQPADKTTSAAAGVVCMGSSTNIIISAPQENITYDLRNTATNAVVSTFTTGASTTDVKNISLPTGPVNTNSTFNVLATFVNTGGGAGCSAQMSTAVPVSVYSTGQWIGATTGDWNIASNWCGGVPTATSNVLIPAGAAVTIASADAFASSLNIAPGGSLLMTGAYNLSLSPNTIYDRASGAFTNNGTFDAGNSTGNVVFLGGGSVTGTTTFKNVNTYGPLNFGPSVTVTGTFSLMTGGSVTGNSPTYSCPSAVLLYKPGSTFNRGLEWTSNSGGAGFPASVLVQNNTTVNFAAGGTGYTCYDLQIDAGSSLQQDYAGGSSKLTVGRNVIINGTLRLGGAIGGDIALGGNWTRNTGGVFIHNDRKVIFDDVSSFTSNRTAVSTIAAPASSLKDNEGGFGGEKFAQLWISKASPTDSVVLLSNITITKEIGFTRGTFSLRNSDVTIVSNSNNTADVAPVTNPANVSIRYSGTGKFAVQRFIQNPTAVRSWRLLTAPLQSSSAPTLNEAFQESAVNPNRLAPNAGNGVYNPWPGFGTHITGPGGAYNAASGFDQGTNSGSILYANAAGAWLTPASTTGIKVTDQQGWMLFVRGDRGFTIGNQYVPAENTTLEPKGRINVGTVTVPVAAGKQIIANPYPSAISLLNVDVAGTKGGNRNFYLWDPKYFTSYTQPGKWVTFSGIGNSFVKTTSYSSYPANGTIESGVAFVADLPSAGTITFQENDKLSLTSSLTGIANRPSGNPAFPMFRSDIYAKSDTGYSLTDGVLNVFNTAFNNAANDDDAKKFISFNTKESLSILRDSMKIAIEKRNTIKESDTIFFSMTKFNEIDYRFRFEATDIPYGIDAFLEDKFTGDRMPVSTDGATEIDFTITSHPLSKAEDRFRVVFKSAVNVVLPVTFKTIKAWQQNDNITIDWKVENELNIAAYQVEKSVDGEHFFMIGKITATGASGYTSLDKNPQPGDNYYRVASLDKSGDKKYSAVVKVNIDAKSSMTIFPNPVIGNTINIMMKSAPEGEYSIGVYDFAGKPLYRRNLVHTPATISETITLTNELPAGSYNVNVLTPDGSTTVLSFVK